MARTWLFQDHRRKERLGAKKCPWSVGWIDQSGARRSKTVGSKAAAKDVAQKIMEQLNGNPSRIEGVIQSSALYAKDEFKNRMRLKEAGWRSLKKCGMPLIVLAGRTYVKGAAFIAWAEQQESKTMTSHSVHDPSDKWWPTFRIAIPCYDKCDCGEQKPRFGPPVNIMVGNIRYEMVIPWCRLWKSGVFRSQPLCYSAELFGDATGYDLVKINGRGETHREPPYPAIKSAIRSVGHSYVVRFLLQEAWDEYREMNRCEICGRLPSIPEALCSRWHARQSGEERLRGEQFECRIADHEGNDGGGGDLLDALADLLIDLDDPYLIENRIEEKPTGNRLIEEPPVLKDVPWTRHSLCSVECTKAYLHRIDSDYRREKLLKEATRRTSGANAMRELNEFLTLGAIHELATVHETDRVNGRAVGQPDEY